MIGEGEIREWALSFYLKHADAKAQKKTLRVGEPRSVTI